MYDIDRRILQKSMKELKPLFKSLSYKKEKAKKGNKIERISFIFEEKKQIHVPLYDWVNNEVVETQAELYKREKIKQEQINNKCLCRKLNFFKLLLLQQLRWFLLSKRILIKQITDHLNPREYCYMMQLPPYQKSQCEIKMAGGESFVLNEKAITVGFIITRLTFKRSDNMRRNLTGGVQTIDRALTILETFPKMCTGTDR
uniref:Replication protein n=1 Tax=Vibrio coralliilyticus TaxID=190893 RepID=M1FVA5_9VIBR|nr:hypothetical protein [Vibrio coralliilyticus]AFV27421.1 replication protein [Vibrio coralliilyticus]